MHAGVYVQSTLGAITIEKSSTALKGQTKNRKKVANLTPLVERAAYMWEATTNLVRKSENHAITTPNSTTQPVVRQIFPGLIGSHVSKYPTLLSIADWPLIWRWKVRRLIHFVTKHPTIIISLLVEQQERKTMSQLKKLILIATVALYHRSRNYRIYSKYARSRAGWSNCAARHPHHLP